MLNFSRKICCNSKLNFIRRENMELKFYELIGIWQWKKFVLWLSARLFILIHVIEEAETII